MGHLFCYCFSVINLRFGGCTIYCNITDAQSAFTELQGVIDHFIENCFSEQTVTINYKNRHPCLTAKLKASIKKRNVCEQNPDNMELHNEYKAY